MDKGINIHLCTQKDPLVLPGETRYVAENLCIYAAKHCGISPASRHLFAMWCPAKHVWLSPSTIIDMTSQKELVIHFLLRFKPPCIKRMKEQTDPQAFNYYFHQMRNDFLQGKIKQLQNHVEESLGLAATDIIREAIELQVKPDNVKHIYTNFLPKELCKWSMVFLKDRLSKATMKGWANSRQDLDYVKEEYMKQLTNLVPDYCCEQFQAQIDENGKVWQVVLQVDPYSEKQSGLQMQVKGSKGAWTHICSIENLCYISMRSDGTVEISRRNGIPQYLRFSNMDQTHSFVSLLDGYYRLMEKWTFNICKDLVTPSLLNLRMLKCHGPIRRVFSYQKLKEKGKNEPGSYILRESASSYDEYRLDVCDSANNVKTYRIQQAENGDYCIDYCYDQTFTSVPKLLDHFTKASNGLKLKKCIPPSEYEKTPLLLCRPSSRDLQSLKSRGECSCSAQCIPHDAIVFDQQCPVEFAGKLTIVKPAHLRRGGDNLKSIVIKQLKPEAVHSHTQEFLSQCDRVLFWQCDAIIATVGMVLSPLSFVMEYLPLGRLDVYLEEHCQTLQQVDLVEASNYIARALWYLDEQQCCHGKIRCHNILVSSHSNNSFRVKLADPGIITYGENDIHWIPPECYNDYMLAAKSAAADIWAFGTTLWEMFSYGEIPFREKKQSEIKEWYVQGHRLLPPPGCHADIGKLMNECWVTDPDNRKRPQAIMRDVNQILYEVYNSRRTHSYATIYSQENIPATPVSPPPNQSHIETTNHRNNFLKNVAFKLVSSTGFSYDHLSNSSGTSDQSRSTIMSDATESPAVPVANLIKLDEGEFRDSNTPVLEANSQSHWIIDSSQLVLAERLGQGFYGEVYKATLNHPGCSETVAVKRIRKSALSEECFQGLLLEFSIMKTLRHENIVEIKAFAEEPEVMLVMEFIKLGSLLAYLTMHKQRIRCAQLLKFGADIANGMNYLEQKHIVHRDLAARNILVASEDCVKISDFGLARFTENDYYKMKTERNLPIRWYAPESIMQMKFSHKSDVWSFGITLWEMFSYGENPVIPGISDPKLAEALQKGIRLACPEYCPLEVYGLMKDCWELDSHKRPSFAVIREQIVELTKRSWT